VADAERISAGSMSRCWTSERTRFRYALDAHPALPLVSEYGILYSSRTPRMIPLDPPEPDRPGLCPDPQDHYRPHAAARAPHLRQGQIAEKLGVAPAGQPRAASVAPAGTGRRKRPQGL
jgi:hypothetical protein